MLGQNFSRQGHLQTRADFRVRTIFCNAATCYMYIKHQVGFTAHEIVLAKLDFKREASKVGVKVTSYMSDNCVYTSNEFGHALENKEQKNDIVELKAITIMTQLKFLSKISLKRQEL